MPIRPENKHHPADWKQIRERILKRDRYCCKWCKVENHAVGYRDRKGEWHRLAGNGPCDASGVGRTWPGYQLVSYSEAREIADFQNTCVDGRDDDGNRWIVIVLTVAHLDHDPRNCADNNLAALCQKCHNTYDMPVRARGRKKRAEKEAGMRYLPEMKR